MHNLATIAQFLDRELKVSDFKDSSHNGLQVENSGRVRKICCGVDATMGFFEEAKRRGADMVICHHGISWGDSLKRITDLNYRRIAYLVRNDMALYACHLPLDAHPVYGNNVQICKSLRLRNIVKFGSYRDCLIGFAGEFAKPIPYDAFKKRVQSLFHDKIRSMDFGKKMVRTVAVISGGGAGELAEAGRKGIDVFLTGESKLTAYHEAQEYQINAIFAGHYATEMPGVRAVADLLKRKFRIKTEFVNLHIPY